MKSFSLISTLAVLSSFALATPTPDAAHRWASWKDDGKGRTIKSPFEFTSTYHIKATPDQVINGTVPTPGQPGAVGYFNFGINSYLDTICYNITLYGVTGGYQSPALTATHIHQANKGASGPPRIAFPNPVGDDYVRRSVGCLTGPFRTGVNASGQDTGSGFTVKQIEDNPSNFFCDTHTAMFVPGAVRGQLNAQC